MALDAEMAQAVPESSLLCPATWAEAWRFWLKLGLISFGGPAGQIAIMHRELVERRRWISQQDFMHGLNVCMLLPGPEAHQLAIYLGWRLHGWRGGCVAGLCFVLPAALLLLLLSLLFVLGEKMAMMQAALKGGMAAVLALIGMSLWRMGKRALISRAHGVLALLSCVLMLSAQVSFLWIMLAAAAYGLWRGAGSALHEPELAAGRGEAMMSRPQVWKRMALVLLLGGGVWLAPLLSLQLWLGEQATVVQQGWFFSRAALVTFGGAYAVLPYVAQQAVEHFGWLSHAQMMSGMALAEITPGPLIIVLQFVGFVGAWQHPGTLLPWASALLGAGMTTWATFVPSFVMIFLVAPWIAAWGQMPRWNAALSFITAAVVGVMLQLGLTLARHALWPAQSDWQWQHFEFKLAALFLLAFLAMRVGKVAEIVVIIACGAVGLLLW